MLKLDLLAYRVIKQIAKPRHISLAFLKLVNHSKWSRGERKRVKECERATESERLRESERDSFH